MGQVVRLGAVVYWAGLPAVWLWGHWWTAAGQELLGMDMPFLPLLALSSYCSLGVLALFGWGCVAVVGAAGAAGADALTARPRQPPEG